MDKQNIEQLWTHLHWLTVLAQQGSYTAAARRLSVSKAAVSQHIAALERAAGVPLVRRTTRSVHLTDAGRQLVEGIGGAYEQIALGFSGVRDLAATPQGTLRVTAPVALARQHLLSAMPAFLRRYPGIRLELDLSDRLASLASEGYDLAVRHVSAPPDTHVAWKLCDTRSVLVASPAYLAAQGRPAHPDALQEHDCLHYPRPRGGTLAWTFQRAAAGLQAARGRGVAYPRRGAAPQGGHDAQAPRPAFFTAPIRSRLAANNSEVLREMALAGLGITLVPDFSVQQAVREGLLEVVLPEWQPVGSFGAHIYAVRPYAAHVPQGVSVYVAHLREVFQAGFGM